jgi:hypothetical protein
VSVPDALTVEPGSLSEDYMSYRGGATSGPLETVETQNGIEAPAYSVTNLAFRRLSYTQTANVGGGISGNLTLVPSGLSPEYVGTITNQSSMTLQNVTLSGVPIGSLAPGQSLPVKVGVPQIRQDGRVETKNRAKSNYDEDAAQGPQGSGSLIDSDRSSALLVASTSASGYGPQDGTDVSGSMSATVVVHIPIVNSEGKL